MNSISSDFFFKKKIILALLERKKKKKINPSLYLLFCLTISNAAMRCVIDEYSTNYVCMYMVVANRSGVLGQWLGLSEDPVDNCLAKPLNSISSRPRPITTKKKNNHFLTHPSSPTSNPVFRDGTFFYTELVQLKLLIISFRDEYNKIYEFSN